MLKRPDPTFNRAEMKAMLILQRNPHTLFSHLPEDMLALSKYFLDLLDALKEAVYGKLEALHTRLDRAKKNKELLRILLLQKDGVVTPNGLQVKCTTLLGCAICAGDPEMVAMIKPYFLELVDGEVQLRRQLEYYRPCIEEILTQKPENLKWLFDLIIKSPLEWIAAELATGKNYDRNFSSPLREALNIFRAKKLNSKK
ncbi:MAG: hypothetical protein JO149_05585, partial [Gammaproteobacteria bacterium]|nr:hypothetical protein [Gammaproteobacteria bacterium]